MKIQIEGTAVTSAHFKTISTGVSCLIINTLERWHNCNTIGCDYLAKEVTFYWWQDEDNVELPHGTLTLIAESDQEYDEISRLRYTLHEKDQIEIMFIDEGLL